MRTTSMFILLLLTALPAAVYGGPLSPTFTDVATGMEFVLVKGGCYEMGNVFGDGDADEKPPHEVCVNDFYLGKHEVTNAQFKKFVDEKGYRTTAEQNGSGWGFVKENAPETREMNGLTWRHPLWPGDSIEKKPDHPVVQVSWNDAKEFAKWLAAKNSRTIRLPYEAEWEFAARNGGRSDKYSWGNGAPQGNVADAKLLRLYPKLETFEKHDDGYAFTAPVGSYRMNESGVYDMTGNVWEWCEDWYAPDYYGDSPKNRPTGPASGQKKVIRGGAWNNIPRILRTTNRDDAEPGSRAFNLGFRLAIGVK